MKLGGRVVRHGGASQRSLKVCGGGREGAVCCARMRRSMTRPLAKMGGGRARDYDVRSLKTQFAVPS